MCWKLAAPMLSWHWHTVTGSACSMPWFMVRLRGQGLPVQNIVILQCMKTESPVTDSCLSWWWLRAPEVPIFSTESIFPLWETFSVNKTTELMILFNKLCLNLRLDSGLNCQSNILPELTMYDVILVLIVILVIVNQESYSFQFSW